MAQNRITIKSLWLVALQVLLLAALYFAAGQASFSLSVSHHIVTLAIFASEGFALAAVILLGKRLWLGVFLGQLVLALYNGLAWHIALGISITNSLEAVIGAILFHRMALQPSFLSMRDVSGLWLLIFLVLQPFSTSLGISLLWLDDSLSSAQISNAWFSWWFGNSLGQALFTPLLLSFFADKKSLKQKLHGVSWLGLLFIPIVIINLLPLSFSTITIACTVTILLLILIAVKSNMAMVNLATATFITSTLFFSKQQLSKILFDGDIILFIDLNVHLLAIMLTGQFIAALLAEYKQAHLAQQQASEHLQKIADYFPGVIYQFRLNPDGSSCFPYASVGLQKICGISPKDLQDNADKAFAVVHPDDYNAVVASIMDSAQHLTPWQFDYRVRFEDGTVRWLSGHSVPQREQSGSTLWYGFIEDVTKAKHKELEYETVIKSSINGFWCNDFSGRFLSVNTALSNMLGYSEQELLSLSIMDIEAAENASDTASHLQKIMQKGHDSFETQHRRKDGRIIDVEINVLYVESLGQRFFVFVYDITESKQAQKQLIASEEKYRTLFNSIQDGIVFVDMQGTIVECNQHFADMLGYSQQELNQLTFYQLTPKKYDALHVQMIEQDVSINGYCELFEKEYIRKDGSIFPVELRAWLRKDDQGNAQGRWAMVRDISKRKQMEEALHKSHDELLHYFDQPFIGMLTSTYDKKTIHVNDTFCKIVGYSPAEMEAIDWEKLTYPEDIALSQHYFNQAIRGEIDTFQMEKRYIHKDGRLIYVDLAVKCVRNAEGKIDYFIGIMLDITGRKSIERYLQKNQALLQTAQRAARLGHYVTNLKTGVWKSDLLLDEILGIDNRFKRDFAHWQQLMFPEDREHVVNYLAQTINDHNLVPYIEYRITRQYDGIMRWVALWAHNFYDENGYPMQQVGMIQDMTERKQMEEELRISEQKFRLLLKKVPLALGVSNSAGEIIYINDRYTAVLGYTIEDIPTVEHWWLNAYPDETYRQRVQKIWTAAIEKAFSEGTDVEPREYNVTCKNGTLRTMMISGMLLENNSFIATFTDITERKQAESQLRIAATVFEAQEGMLITDANGLILKVNHAFTEITGYSAAESIGQTPHFLQSGRHDKGFYDALWQSINSTGGWQGEIWNKRKNGEVFPQWLTITAVKDNSNNSVTHYVATQTDITERKASEEHINSLVFYDPLTLLPNRRLLLERLKHGIDLYHRTGSQMAVLMMDLDKFKAVNDSLGHAAGDELLRQVAERMTSRLRDVDMVVRLGGDEFVILIEAIEHYEEAARVAELIIYSLSQPFTLYQIHQVYIGASIGIAIHPQHGECEEALMDNADTALYYAKDQGRGCFAYFSESMTQKASEHLALESRLRNALNLQELHVYFQPQLDVQSGRIIGAEALLRWYDPDNGFIAPSDFIHLAEETGLIISIGEWVLQETCRIGRQWLDEGLAAVTLAVNISAYQFRHYDMNALVTRVLENTRFPAEYLKLEMTESGLMENQERILPMLNALNNQGVRLVIDDFGTGYSSLARLKYLPVDLLKIDKTFIDNIPDSQNDCAITSTIIAMAHHLGCKVAAEGVETQQQLAFLQQQGCDIYQGYLYRPALAADDFKQLLRAIDTEQ